MMCQLAQRLQDLHETGWVHRDIKPGNAMLLLQKRKWTLIDFGCAAEIGANVPIVCTIAYASPEVLQALGVGKTRMPVTAAMDAWCLGILAMEMFSGKKLFSDGHKTKTQVCAIVHLWASLPSPARTVLSSTACLHAQAAHRKPPSQHRASTAEGTVSGPSSTLAS